MTYLLIFLAGCLTGAVAIILAGVLIVALRARSASRFART